MKTKAEKFLERHNYADYYAESLRQLEQNGLLNRGRVMKLQVLFAHENPLCVECGSTENPTADHIVPIFFLKAFGYPAEQMFRPEWYQVLCRKCNYSKKHRFDWDNPSTYEILNQVMIDKPTFEYAYLAKEHAKQKAQQEFHLTKAKHLPPISMDEANANWGLTAKL